MVFSLKPSAVMARMAIFLSSVLCAVALNAQDEFEERLFHVLATQDLEGGLTLYKGIDENAIRELPDSVLFDYHYLGGWVNSELADPQKAVRHLSEAKRLCDTSLGTHSLVYMEVIEALGRECMEMGDYKSALSFYQEGIAKSMACSGDARQEFGLLLMGLAECYEYEGWLKELPLLFRDAWAHWDKDAEPFSEQNFYPMWALRETYRRYGMYEEALATSDCIMDYLEGEGGKAENCLAGELYFRGNILESLNRMDEAVATYERALAILAKHNEDRGNYRKSILGNRLVAVIHSSGWERYGECLDEIRKYAMEMGDDKLYSNALYTVAGEFNAMLKYDIAKAISDKLLGLPLAPEERDVVERQAKKISNGIELTSGLAQLETEYLNQRRGSLEWLQRGCDLSRAYHLLGEFSKNRDVLEAMHAAIEQDDVVDSDYHDWVLGNLIGLCFEVGDFPRMLKYAEEKLAYLKTLENVPADMMHYALNNVLVAMLKSNQVQGLENVLKEVGKYQALVFDPISEGTATYLHNMGRAYHLQGRHMEAKEHYLEAMRMQKKTTGNISAATVKYLMELEMQMEDEELDL